MMENLEKPMQGKVTGVIIPPPEIRAVVDKTAQYVAKAGKSFEQRILDSKEGKTAKFNFMKLDDPYHSYYELKIREAEEAIAAGKDPATVAAQKSAAKTEEPPAAPKEAPAPSKQEKPVATTARAQPVSIVAKYAQDKPEGEPYPFEFTIQHPTEISALEMDIIKTTAQYTAINGRDFLAAIAQREQRNPLFDFLKPTHMLFSYFTSLVDSYAKIVNPSPQLIQLVESRTKREKVFEYAVHRWGWKVAEEDRKRREQNQANEDQLAAQAIDWNDFTVVEVIEFPEDELFEIPGLGALGISNNNTNNPPAGSSSNNRSLMDNNKAPSNGKGLLSAIPTTTSVSQSVPMSVEENNQDDDEQIKVVSNYQPRIGGNTGSTAPIMVIDPVSNKPVPIEQLEEHMRIQLLDPKWKEEQKRFLDKQKETGFAEGTSIADSLRLFARKRGDIFGQSMGGDGKDSAAAIAELEAAERKKAEVTGSVQWDGFLASIPATQQLKSAVEVNIPMTSTINSNSNIPQIGPSFVSPPPPPLAGNPLLPPPPPTMTNTFLPPPPPPAAPGMPIPSVPGAGFPPPPPPPATGFPFGVPPAPPAFPPVPPMGIPPAPLPNYYSGMPSNINNGNITQDESKTKKPRIDSSSLIPAEEFAAIYTGPCTIDVQLPNDPSNSQFNLNGQTITLHLSGVVVSVKEIKELLSTQHLNQMSTGKIQLKHNHHGFLKDLNSLASLNLGSGTILEMSVKSRGGKR